jgi:hypothetical protein
MDKFLWDPTATDKAEAAFSVMSDAGVTREEARALVDAFPRQPMVWASRWRAYGWRADS